MIERINAAVAEKIMGWKLADRAACGRGEGPNVWITGNASAPTYQHFSPCNDPVDMMMVLEKMKDRKLVMFWRCDRDSGKPRWHAYFRRDSPSGPNMIGYIHSSLPVAVCIAALLAVGGDEESILGAKEAGR